MNDMEGKDGIYEYATIQRSTKKEAKLFYE